MSTLIDNSWQRKQDPTPLHFILKNQKSESTPTKTNTYKVILPLFIA
jgi:hypothetical protein